MTRHHAKHVGECSAASHVEQTLGARYSARREPARAIPGTRLLNESGLIPAARRGTCAHNRDPAGILKAEIAKAGAVFGRAIAMSRARSANYRGPKCRRAPGLAPRSIRPGLCPQE